MDKEKNQCIREKTGAQNTVEEIKQYQKKWLQHRGWTQIECQDRHWDTDRKEEGTWDGRIRDGGTNSTFRIKEQEKRLTLNKHDDDDDENLFYFRKTWCWSSWSETLLTGYCCTICIVVFYVNFIILDLKLISILLIYLLQVSWLDNFNKPLYDCLRLTNFLNNLPLGSRVISNKHTLRFGITNLTRVINVKKFA